MYEWYLWSMRTKMTTCIGRVKGRNVYYRLFVQFTGFSHQFPQFRFNSFAALSYLLDLADPRLKKHTKKLFFTDYLTINYFKNFFFQDWQMSSELIVVSREQPTRI